MKKVVIMRSFGLVLALASIYKGKNSTRFTMSADPPTVAINSRWLMQSPIEMRAGWAYTKPANGICSRWRRAAYLSRSVSKEKSTRPRLVARSSKTGSVKLEA